MMMMTMMMMMMMMMMILVFKHCPFLTSLYTRRVFINKQMNAETSCYLASLVAFFEPPHALRGGAFERKSSDESKCPFFARTRNPESQEE